MKQESMREPPRLSQGDTNPLPVMHLVSTVCGYSHAPKRAVIPEYHGVHGGYAVRLAKTNPT